MTGYFKTLNGNMRKNLKSHPVGQFSPSTLGKQMHTAAPPCKTIDPGTFVSAIKRCRKGGKTHGQHYGSDSYVLVVELLIILIFCVFRVCFL